MTTDISRHFLRAGGREVHYRRAGSGPPFVLLHASPQSSAFVVPHLLPLADRFTLIGLDTPGYGGSDPLPLAAPTCADYAESFVETLDALGIGRAHLYGTHTGAHIAIELALRRPERVAVLVLDGVSFNTPEEARERYERYAPEFAPTTDGAHLAWAWQHTRDQILFYPWFRAEKARRLDTDMAAPGYIHDIVLAKMDAAGYWLGYRAAFSHDSRAALYRVTAETVVVAREGDILAPEAKRLSDLPANIRIVETTAADRVEAIRTSLAAANADPQTPAPPAVEPRAALYRSYATLGGGQRLVRRAGEGAGAGRPLVLLHGEMATSRALAGSMAALATARPVLAMDIAGNGESDPLPDGASGLDAFAADVPTGLIDACGVAEFDLLGRGVGAALALSVARRSGDRAGRIVLDRPILPDADDRDDLLRHYAPDVEPRWDGTHLLTAWHMLRDAALFWPWYRRTRAGIRWVEPSLDPHRLQAHLCDWLKGRRTYGAYVRACLGAETDALLAARQPVLILDRAGDAIERFARKAEGALPAARSVSPADREERRAAVAAFLGP